LTTNYLVGPTGNATEYFILLYENAYAKFAQGFPVSVVDVFGQFWRQYLPKSWGYSNYSDIALLPNHSFALGLGPMPMLTLAEVVPAISPKIDNIMFPGLNSSNLTSYELTPFEFGSWVGGRIQGFMPTQFLGSIMNKGKPVNNKSCVIGFDKMTFMQGATADAFNFWFIDSFFNIPLFAKRDKMTKMPGPLEKRATVNTSIIIPSSQQNSSLVVIVERVSELFNQSFNQSLWATLPNPFLNYNKAMAGSEELLLVQPHLHLLRTFPGKKKS
jgi:lysophospholipase